MTIDEKEFHEIKEETLNDIVGGVSQNDNELAIGEVLDIKKGKITLSKNDCFSKGDWIYVVPVNYFDISAVNNIRLHVYYPNGTFYMNSGYLTSFLNGAIYLGNNTFKKA